MNTGDSVSRVSGTRHSDHAAAKEMDGKTEGNRVDSLREAPGRLDGLAGNVVRPVGHSTQVAAFSPLLIADGESARDRLFATQTEADPVEETETDQRIAHASDQDTGHGSENAP